MTQGLSCGVVAVTVVVVMRGSAWVSIVGVMAVIVARREHVAMAPTSACRGRS